MVSFTKFVNEILLTLKHEHNYSGMFYHISKIPTTCSFANNVKCQVGSDVISLLLKHLTLCKLPWYTGVDTGYGISGTSSLTGMKPIYRPVANHY